MTMKHGAIQWVEIPAKDGKASQKFYETVFGWKIEHSDPQYPMFTDTSGNVGGGFNLKESPAPTGGVLIYLSVDSVDTILPKISANGGTVVKGKTAISADVGWWASFKDPAGNTIGLYESAQK